jgi:hypothetical protein
MSRKKISGDYGWILPVGLLGLAAYLLYKFTGIFSGSGAAKNAEQATSTITAGTKTTLASLAAQGQVPTLTAAQGAALANDIFNAGLTVNTGGLFSSSNTSGVAQIMNDLIQCRNDADLYLIMSNFGTRQVSLDEWSMCSITGFECDALDLQSFVANIFNYAQIPGDQLADLNSQLASNGLTYQF